MGAALPVPVPPRAAFSRPLHVLHIVSHVAAAPRFGSTRLPGKPLLRILGGEPMIAHVVRQARAAASVSRVLVATDLAARGLDMLVELVVMNPCWRWEQWLEPRGELVLVVN